MKAKLIRIGNSRGLRLPKTLIEELGLGDEVVLEVQGNAVMISSVPKTRDGWALAFKKMSENGDDRLQGDHDSTELNDGLVNDFDDSDWEW